MIAQALAFALELAHEGGTEPSGEMREPFACGHDRPPSVLVCLRETRAGLLALLRRDCDRRADGRRHRREETMGDKSPKSKQRDQKQKNAARAEGAAQAKSKQDSYRQTPSIPGKSRK
jgi:hypothetical protein